MLRSGRSCGRLLFQAFVLWADMATSPATARGEPGIRASAFPDPRARG